MIILARFILVWDLTYNQFERLDFTIAYNNNEENIKRATMNS